MHAFDVLGDPVRRRILELLADGERSAGELGAVVQEEFGISQPGVSQHLRVLRDNGFATVRAEGTRRLYAVDPAPLREVDVWLERYRRFWTQRLDALGTELARGKRERRMRGGTGSPDTAGSTGDAGRTAGDSSASRTGGDSGWHGREPDSPGDAGRTGGRTRGRTGAASPGKATGSG
ncbi:ArsR/SmtB family transcription factor [Streptosporangium roseum]|uniref:ArsR/SmtB family transcription factor n=1 Tax=Streptosporangium roseum TaxID=2001 RepID=UPI00332FE913